MKIKLKVVSMTLKFALLGVMACAFAIYGESKETYKAFWEYSKLSKDEFMPLWEKCNKGNKNACQKLIDNGLPSVSQCDDFSCVLIGQIYDNAKRYKQAFEYYKKGCELKNGGSCMCLGSLYDEGQGVRQDSAMAKKYYGEACDLGSEVGCDYYNKLISEDKLLQAVKGCVENNNACQKFIDNGDLPSVNQCDGFKLSCFFSGQIYEFVGQYKQAFEYYKKGCGLEHQNEKQLAGSCLNLGALYYKGKGVRQDKVVAKKYFGKACDLGEKSSCNNYRILNEQGIK